MSIYAESRGALGWERFIILKIYILFTFKFVAFFGRFLCFCWLLSRLWNDVNAPFCDGTILNLKGKYKLHSDFRAIYWEKSSGKLNKNEQIIEKYAQNNENHSNLNLLFAGRFYGNRGNMAKCANRLLTRCLKNANFLYG